MDIKYMYRMTPWHVPRAGFDRCFMTGIILQYNFTTVHTKRASANEIKLHKTYKTGAQIIRIGEYDKY